MTINKMYEGLAETSRLLDAARLNPMLCDTPVAYIDCGVKAGLPSELGDVVSGEYLLLPKELLRNHPTFLIDVSGESMKDSGFTTGDRLQVALDYDLHDGDVIVVFIDRECTVKTYCTDAEGRHWLVPRNEAFDAILLTEQMDVKVVGKVVGYMKDVPRTPYGECMRTIERTKVRLAERPATGAELARRAVRAVAAEVKNGRQWYAVYRGLVDCEAVGEGDYKGFVALVAEALGADYSPLPSAKELGRMAVLSFRQPVERWRADDAPVSGQRFHDYQRLARLTIDALS